MLNSAQKYEIRKKLKENRMYARLQGELERLQEMLLECCQSEFLSVTENLRRIIISGGKRIRPSLAWICWCMGADAQDQYPGETKEILPLMCMLELMHTASLIHDDVVDNADERRGVITIHKISGRCSAVQSGDYLLARAMEYLHIYKGTGINEALADISMEMCLGEFQQMSHLFDLKACTVDVYYSQIKRKTAYLIGASCYCGALAGGMDPKNAEILREYGEQIGTAFQLKDDILDYQSSQETGKPAGQDIRRGIFTLPFLLAVKEAPCRQIEELAAKRCKTEEEIGILMKFVKDHHGIEETEKCIRACGRKARTKLEQLPECPARDALSEMAVTLENRKI